MALGSASERGGRAVTRGRPRNSCAKGKRGERALAAALRELGLEGARRTVQGRGGSDAADLEGLAVRVEVKVGSRAYVNPLAALRQCEADGDAARDPRPRVAVTKIDRARWVCTIRARTLFALVGHDVPSVIDDEAVSITLPALVALLRAEGADPNVCVFTDLPIGPRVTAIDRKTGTITVG